MTDGFDESGEAGGLGWSTDIQPDVSQPSQTKISHNPITWNETIDAKNALTNNKTAGGDGLISEV
eukprot:4221436-Karenia_brevis.AAC.1